MERIADIPGATWNLVLDAAPWLLFGLLLAGVIRAWLPDRLVARWLGGRGLGAVVRAAIIGTPLPLCSCGVVPTAVALRRQGASRGATVSFLIATPENGADSIALTYALMGPVMAIARPIAALASAIAAGALTLVLRAGARASDAQAPATNEQPDACACCNSTNDPTSNPSCCDTAPASDAGAPPGPLARLIQGIRYAFTTLLDDLAPWLALGLLLAGILSALVPPDAMAAWGRGPLAMIVMAIIGVPIYVCATAFTPVGASLLLAGVSPGAVLVLLLAGPATNLGTIGIVKRELGTPTLIAYLLGVIGMAIVCGIALDAVAADLPIAQQVAHAHELFPRAVSIAAAALLIIVAIRPLRRAVGVLALRRASRAAPAPEKHP